MKVHLFRQQQQQPSLLLAVVTEVEHETAGLCEQFSLQAHTRGDSTYLRQEYTSAPT